MLRYNYNELMKQLKQYEEIVEEDGAWQALLKNSGHCPSFFYERSHGSLRIEVKPAPYAEGLYTANLYIWSIDDGSIVLLGPAETKEEAEKRLLRLKAEATSWEGWIPDRDQVEKAENNTGCYWNR